MRHVISLPGIVEANRKLDLLLSGVIPTVPTINNTDETSTLDASQVAGATAAFAEVDALYAQQNADLVDLNARLTALEN